MRGALPDVMSAAARVPAKRSPLLRSGRGTQALRFPRFREPAAFEPWSLAGGPWPGMYEPGARPRREGAKNARSFKELEQGTGPNRTVHERAQFDA